MGREFLDAALKDAQRTLHDTRVSLKRIGFPLTEQETRESIEYVQSVKILMDDLYETLEIANLKFLDENITVDDLCNIFRIMLDIQSDVPGVFLFA